MLFDSPIKSESQKCSISLFDAISKKDLPNTFWSRKQIHIRRIIKWIFKESKGYWCMCIRIWISSLINAKNPRPNDARSRKWWWWHKGKSSNQSEWRINGKIDHLQMLLCSVDQKALQKNPRAIPKHTPQKFWNGQWRLDRRSCIIPSFDIFRKALEPPFQSRTCLIHSDSYTTWIQWRFLWGIE